MKRSMSMNIKAAPMEGLTDATFRRAHFECFGGVAKYYIPFISPTQHHLFTPHDLRAISPEVNAGVPVVPQLLCRDAEHFLWAAGELAAMGYDEVNLNIGCPSGTVTAKGKGSGMLRDLPGLRAMLDEVFARAPLHVSIKTRIGFTDQEEWPAILELLADYPMHELIIHPRTRSEFYKGEVHQSAFDLASQYDLPLVYNGDLFSVADCTALQEKHPGVPMMLGRGLLANPALPRQLLGGPGITVPEIRRFHDRMYEAYQRIFTPSQAHSRMRELMKYMACCFQGVEKPLKALRKSTPDTYEQAIERILDCPLRKDPGYGYDTWMGK